MDLAATVLEHGLRSALIIDDAYELPTSKAVDPEAKTRFLRRIRDHTEEATLLKERFPEVDTNVDDQVTGLLASDSVVDKLWSLYIQDKKKFSFCSSIFREFEEKVATKRADLLPLEAFLSKLGLTIDTGAKLPVEGKIAEYGIVFIDFFLVEDEKPEDALNRAVDLGKRFALPQERDGIRFRPLVFLISSRPQHMRAYQEAFRNKSRIKGSFFRFVEKQHLSEDKFSIRLTRSLEGYSTAMVLADYLDIFRQAAGAAIDKLEELELTDLSLLNVLRIEAENERLGNYLNWLLAEAISGGIQSDETLRNTAFGLDERINHSLDGHIVSPRNVLFDIYTKAVFRYDVRDRTGEERLIGVGLGDVFTMSIEDSQYKAIAQAPAVVASESNRSSEGSAETTPVQNALSQTEETYFAVLTPTSDILRQADPGYPILCVVGSPASAHTTDIANLLGVELFGKEQHLIATESDDKTLYRIVKWNKKKLETIPLKYLSDPAKAKRLARLQPLFAQQLKQTVLGDLARVGVPAMPTPIKIYHAEVTIRITGNEITFTSAGEGYFSAIVANKRKKSSDVQTITFTDEFLHRLKTNCETAKKGADVGTTGFLSAVITACDSQLKSLEVKDSKQAIAAGQRAKVFFNTISGDPGFCSIVLSEATH